MTAKSISQLWVRSTFDYDPLNGVFLWNSRSTDDPSREPYIKGFNTRYAGKAAGKIMSSDSRPSYVVIFTQGNSYLAHRLAWVYMTGEQPPDQIDHIDGNGLNNSWANLRDGTFSNRYNLSRYKNNRSGVTGVHWEGGAWRAVVSHNRKSYWIGRFSDINEAKKAVEKFRASIGLFTEDHGIRLPQR